MSSVADLVAESAAEPTKEPETFWAKPLKEKCSYIKDFITVEPLLASYIFGLLIFSGGPSGNLDLEKSCRSNLNFSDSVCDGMLVNNSMYLDEYKEIQNVQGKIVSWITPLQSFVPLLLILFLGSYSDRHKLRRPFILFPVLGQFIGTLGVIVSVFYMREWSLEAMGALQVVVPSFFGGQSMLVMAAYSYVADISSMEMRTIRISVLQIVSTLTSLISTFLGGILYDKIGYVGLLSLAALSLLLGLIYGIFWIREPRAPTSTGKSFIADVLDPKDAIETFKFIVVKSPGNHRGLVLAVLFILFVVNIVATGESAVLFNYGKLLFEWGPQEYNFFLTAASIISLVGVSVGVPILSKYFKLEDTTIMGLTFLGSIASSIIFGLGKTLPFFYIAQAVNILGGITILAIRSFATKIVSENDIGKSQSLFAIFETIGSQVVAVPIYDAGVYLNTLNTFPAAFFFVTVLLYAVCVLVVIWMHFKSKIIRVEPSHDKEKSDQKVPEHYQTTHL